MTTGSTTPRNAQEALQQASRYERAKRLREEGYTFTDTLSDGSSIAVCKPGRLAASYWIVDGECDCPDRLKNKKSCKHELAWEGIRAEDEDELAGLEEQCRMWENEEGRHLDLIPLPTLTKDVVRAMEQDLTKVQADIASQAERHTGYLHSQHLAQRAGRLENALVTVNAYRELPEPTITGPASCRVCKVANLHGVQSCYATDCPNPRQ